MNLQRDGSRIAGIVLAVVLTAVLAVALWWGFLRDPAQKAAEGMRVALEVSKAADGAPPSAFDTGQPATTSQSATDPGSNFVVRDGKLTYKPTTNDVSAAYYSTPNMGAPVNALGARFVFYPGQGTNGAVTLLISRGVRGELPWPVPPIPLHFVVTAVNWNLAVGKDEQTPLEIIAAGDHKEPLVEDGRTAYTVSAEIDGARVKLHLPDGQERVVEDARISQWQGNYATFEVYSNHGLTDSIGGFEELWADSRSRD
ncbi:hypothetical protein LV457_04990 [Mycobacterium sp. MYCO198283]|uniref:hypothetical protein n=1 Tax=Mycobacterium sp. MYCO198283 TaxID=2883505 RepID=UPI001E420DF4|nr:hypothetical protein [Mycobacterium sp. MYCO198283]MCG5431647.1 hypothetical protein [Mycobacterium sp. MYCO198283]